MRMMKNMISGSVGAVSAMGTEMNVMVGRSRASGKFRSCKSCAVLPESSSATLEHSIAHFL